MLKFSSCTQGVVRGGGTQVVGVPELFARVYISAGWLWHQIIAQTLRSFMVHKESNKIISSHLATCTRSTISLSVAAKPCVTSPTRVAGTKTPPMSHTVSPFLPYDLHQASSVCFSRVTCTRPLLPCHLYTIMLSISEENTSVALANS